MVLKKQADVGFAPDSAFSSLMTLSKLLSLHLSLYFWQMEITLSTSYGCY